MLRMVPLSFKKDLLMLTEMENFPQKILPKLNMLNVANSIWVIGILSGWVAFAVTNEAKLSFVTSIIVMSGLFWAVFLPYVILGAYRQPLSIGILYYSLLGSFIIWLPIDYTVAFTGITGSCVLAIVPLIVLLEKIRM